LNSKASINFTDSIQYHIERSDYKTALQIIHQNKNLKQEDQIKLDLYEAEVMLALGEITDAGHILIRVKNNMLTSNAIENQLQLRYILLKSCLLNHKGKADSALQVLWNSRHAWAINENRFPREMAEIYGELGKYYSSADEYGHSIKYFNKALNLIGSDRNSKSAMYNASLAHLYWINNQKDSSNRAFDKAQTILKTCNYSNPDMLESYFQLVKYGYHIEDLNLAEAFLSEVLVALQSSYPKDHYLYGRYYFFKGLLSFDRQDFINSFQFANHFENFALKYPVLRYHQRQNLSIMVSILYWYMKDYKQTIFYCNKALQTTPKETNVFFYYIIGRSHQRLKNYSEAQHYFHKIIAKSVTYSSPGDMNICGYTYLELAKNAQSELKFQEVLEYLTQGLKFYHKNPSSSDLGSSIYFELARVYFYNLNNIEKALNNVQLSIVHGCKSYTNKDYLTNPPIDDILYRYTLIEPFALKAYLLYMLYQKDSTHLGLLKASLECQDMAVKLYERNLLNISEENAGLNIADLKVTALNNAVSYATLLYLKTNDFTYADKAFQYAEKSKMQLLLIKTVKNQSMQRAGIPDSIIEKEEKLNHLIVEAENSHSLSNTMDKDPAAHEAGLEKVTRLHEQRDLFIHQLQIKYPAYYQAKYNYQVAGIKEIQKILDKDQVIIEYQLLQTELITFIITPTHFDIRHQLITKKVPAEIQKLRELISVNPISVNSAEVLSEFVHSSEYLYSVLISPVYDQIKNKRLIIIPHNALTQIPFEILIKKTSESKKPTGFRNLNYLIEEFSIIYAYSGNLLLDKERRKRTGKGTGIFLSDFNAKTVFNDSIRFPELKGAESEAHAVKKLSGGKVFKGRKSTESMFKSNAGKFLVLHIASHTLLDAVNPFLSCVLLTPKDTTEDGLLYAWEIGQMKLNAQLVVLSGCNSGYGVLKKNEGLISLARSFLYTGVRTIAFTLWPAADQAGSAISTNFYKGIKKRLTLDVAMQAAKLNFIAEADPVKAHPYFWANYIIVGHDDPIPLGRFPVWLKIAGGLFAVVLLTLAYRKVTS
jgi:CHAT domain-containing protein